jgi:hypothetical protein
MHIDVNDPIWDQPIETLPLIQAFPQFNEIKEFKDKNVVLTADHERLFSVISPRKKIIHHRDAVEMIGNAVNEIYNEDPTVKIRSLKQGAQIRAEFKLPEPIVLDLDGDVNELMLYLYNSYDNSLPFKMRIGAMRQICTNGAVIGDEIACMKGRDMANEWSPAGLSNMITKMIDDAQAVVTAWRKWRTIDIDYDFAIDVLQDRLPKSLVQKLMVEEYPKSLWELYNDLTYMATHKSPSDRARVSFDSAIAQIFYSRRSPVYRLYGKDEVIAEVEED